MKSARPLVLQDNADNPRSRPTNARVPPSDERILREKARAAIQTGALPTRRPDRTWGGPGVGADCTICGVPVTHDDVELEIEFTLDEADARPGTYRVHPPCFAAWEAELRNL